MSTVWKESPAPPAARPRGHDFSIHVATANGREEVSKTTIPLIFRWAARSRAEPSLQLMGLPSGSDRASKDGFARASGDIDRIYLPWNPETRERSVRTVAPAPP